MAAVIECTERHYQEYEYDKSHPNYCGLIALANYFDVSLDYLAGRGDDPNCHKP